MMGRVRIRRERSKPPRLLRTGGDHLPGWPYRTQQRRPPLGRRHRGRDQARASGNEVRAGRVAMAIVGCPR